MIPVQAMLPPLAAGRAGGATTAAVLTAGYPRPGRSPVPSGRSPSYPKRLASTARAWEGLLGPKCHWWALHTSL